jgi:transaldolase
MTRLHQLFELGQSPWIDNLRRQWLKDGHLAGLVEAGVRGVTSNPTIFAHSIQNGPEYDEEMSKLLETMSVEDAYWELVCSDVTGALEVLGSVFEESGGADGFVSLEVSPTLARDTQATAEAALSFHRRIARPNLMVKIPATKEGLPAIRQVIGAGHNVNVTLIFSLERYREVIEAYMAGLEDLAQTRGPSANLSDVASVASFFVSRVDTEVDRRLDEAAAAGKISEAVHDELVGKAAIAQAQLAYEVFRGAFKGPRWEALARRGARLQRPLWASTSTKNPAYPDLYYVDNLIGPDTVNTMPDQTLEAYLDHGRIERTVDADLPGAHRVLERLAEVGVDMTDVANKLEAAGVKAFEASFEELLGVMAKKAESLRAGAA